MMAVAVERDQYIILQDQESTMRKNLSMTFQKSPKKISIFILLLTVSAPTGLTGFVLGKHSVIPKIESHETSVVERRRTYVPRL